MTTHNAFAGSLVFSARLTPYRSLSPQGFRVLMGVFGTVCFIIGLVFAVAGVWPVMGFMGLDFLLLYWAFKANYKSARVYEDVEISRQHVLVRKVTARGKSTDHFFEQFGTRFEVDRHEEIGITKMKLMNRNREVEVGNFLNPGDRETFSTAFANAMASAKR